MKQLVAGNPLVSDVATFLKIVAGIVLLGAISYGLYHLGAQLPPMKWWFLAAGALFGLFGLIRGQSRSRASMRSGIAIIMMAPALFIMAIGNVEAYYASTSTRVCP